jgi:hypothetical protein
MKRAHVVMVESEETPEIVPSGNGGVRIEAGEDSVELDAGEARAIYLIVRNYLEQESLDAWQAPRP